ncbi:MAG: 3-oxoacyl-[acyl-carrier-protein] reductase [Candidatus Cloacimonetes bacterium]|nr:3-oxoacyl-[acyl-carrier-protein] reductase [Candidatus Cloacimonadota bacterium]
MNLKNRIVLITGAARGIGLAIAEKMAEAGAMVNIVDLCESDIESALRYLKTRKLSAAGFTANVTDPFSIEKVVKEIIAEHDRIDILVNNAGITRDGLLMKMSAEDWDLVINVNLKGTFTCIQKVIRHMLKQRSGVIINIASVIGLIGNAGQANYAASKGGIIALTKSAAKEFAARNIRVNAIAPGFIETDMTKELPQDIVTNYTQAIPLKRMGKPEDVANLCLFLASDQSSYITGQTIQVDGGLIM